MEYTSYNSRPMSKLNNKIQSEIGTLWWCMRYCIICRTECFMLCQLWKFTFSCLPSTLFATKCIYEMSVFLRQKSIVDHCVQTPAKDVTTQHRRNMWKQIKRRGKKIDDDIKNDASFSSNMEMCRFFSFEYHRMTNSNMFAQTASKMWNVSVLFCMHLRQLIVFTLYLLKIYHFSIRHYHFVP